ncbi:MAG: hypothetical protein WC450_04765 [Candidatus Omnitrophota bacterium]
MFFMSLILTALEICAYQGKGVFSFVASRCWLLHGGFYLISSLYVIYKTLRQDVQEKNFRGVLVFFLVGWVIFNIVGSRGLFINHESTQQVADGCDFFKLNDFNYTKTGFIGYPARQYLLLALPSLLLGRNLVALRSGFALAFLLGMMLFYCGLNRYFDENKIGRTVLAPFMALSLLCFPIVVNIMVSSEQAILPLSFTLQAAGWFLLCLKFITPLRVISLAYIGALLATAYTPGIASWGLLIVLVGLHIREQRRLNNLSRLMLWLSLVLFITAVGAASFFTRADLLFRQSGVWVPGDSRCPYLLTALRELFIPSSQAFLPLPVVIYLMLSLMKMFSPRDFWISLWAMMTIFFATLLSGYASPSPPYSLHRALVIIPPVLTSLALTIEPWLANRGGTISQKVLFLALCLGILIPGKNLHDSLRLHVSGVRDEVIYNTLDVVNEYGIDPNDRLRFIVAPENLIYSNLYDCLRYFYPRSEFLWQRDTILKTEIAGYPTLVYLDEERYPLRVSGMVEESHTDFAVVKFPSNDQEARFLRAVYIPAKK